MSDLKAELERTEYERHLTALERDELRAEVARLMAERETERMRLAAWPEIHAERPTWSDLIARLRTTAEALRAFVDSRRESGWAIAAGKNAGPALNKALPDARAVLAQLEKEGLA